MTLTQKIGDTVTHRIPLRWAKRAFTPTGFPIVFSVKLSPNDTDENAVFQKTTGGGGVTIDGNDALVMFLRDDTKDLAAGTLYWGLRATDNDGDSRTANQGELELERDISRLAEPSMDVHTVAPPLLYFSYQSYLDSTTDDPVLTEAQWVARLGGDNSRQITSTVPPLPSRGAEVGQTFTMPYEGLEWFDPSDGSTSVWMWLGAAQDAEDDGVFISQFPTPAATGLPDNAYVDESGDSYVDETGDYYISE